MQTADYSKVLTALRVFAAFVLVGLSLYTAVFGAFDNAVQRSTHLAVVFFLAFSSFVTVQRWRDARLANLLDLVLAVLGMAVVGYIAFNQDAIVARYRQITDLEVWLGVVTCVIVLDCARRVVGWPLAILAAIFLGYAFAGPYLPTAISHRGYSFERIVSHLYLGDDGIFGIPLGVSATYVALIVTFGALLEGSGAGRVLMDMATAATGRARGGPAKAAVVGSSLMGTISGTAVANVLTTGTVSIPLMIRTGYRKSVAGAIEAVSSTGGQIVPPIMGAAAFIMAELTLRPYSEIITAAIIPATLFYVAVFSAVHFEAMRTGIRALAKEDLPDVRASLRQGGHLLISIAVLIYGIAAGYSITYAAFFAIVAILVLAQIKASSRFGVQRLVQMVVSAADSIVVIAVACAAAGLVIGVLSLTGLGLKFASLVITASGGSVVVALVLTMLAALVLGMGLPSAAAYIIVAALLVPALKRLGVEPLSAHMFAFYGAMLSSVTPPVAMAAFAASSLTGSSPMRTSFLAFVIAVPTFFVPFFFVLEPALLMNGSALEILHTGCTAIIGVVAFAAALQGWFLARALPAERLVLLAAGLLLIFGSWQTDLAGLGLVAAIAVLHRNRQSAGPALPTTETTNRGNQT